LLLVAGVFGSAVIKDVLSKVRAACSAVENHSVEDLDRFDEPRTGLILACCLCVLFFYELLLKFLRKSGECDLLIQ
jgi:hypothetical protein